MSERKSRNGDGRRRSRRVFGHVGQCFLRDPVHSPLGHRRQLARLPVDTQLHIQPRCGSRDRQRREIGPVDVHRSAIGLLAQDADQVAEALHRPAHARAAELARRPDAVHAAPVRPVPSQPGPDPDTGARIVPRTMAATNKTRNRLASGSQPGTTENTTTPAESTATSASTVGPVRPGRRPARNAVTTVGNNHQPLTMLRSASTTAARSAEVPSQQPVRWQPERPPSRP